MWNPSYLLATLDQLTNYLEISDAVFDEPKAVFSCTLRAYGKSAPIQAPASWFVENLKFDWEQLINRVAAYSLLTEFNRSSQSLEYAASLLFVQRHIFEHALDWVDSFREEKNLSVRYRSQDRVLERSYPYSAQSKIIAAECLLRGYTINEHAGSHYTVNTPHGIEHIVSRYTCSCHEHQIRKVCAHTHLITEYSSYRPELIRLNLAKITA